jgi:hypothetical protein
VYRSLGSAILGLMHPRIFWLSFRPFLLVSLTWGFLFFLFWESALESMRLFITNSFLTTWLSEMLSAGGWDEFRAVVAPLLLVVILIPVITISLLIFLAFTSVPAVIQHLMKSQRFALIYEAHGGGLLGGIGYAMISILICLILLFLTLPFWWVPPMVAILPPLLWGWLTMRLMSYDVLARHASPDERVALMKKHYWPLLMMGILSGMMGAVPTFFWATSAVAFIFFPVVSFFALWIYSIIFIFASLWFAHYLLEALREYRELNGVIHVN